MAYSKQTWDTTSYVNPTRMNHIEDGIEAADSKTAEDIPYSTGVSVKDKIDELVKYNTVKTAGVITINGTVNIPSTAKNIYICINVNDYVVSPLLKIALHSRYSVPWGYLTWLAIFEFSYLNNVLTFVSENTVAGTKSGGWTTKIEVYYTE